MILNTAPENQAVMSNVLEVNNFSIKATAKSFHILSSGLYSNKIRAIIRELSCNAYDSHVAAGKKEVPFEVHLPSIMEPWFAVRDFGTGLSHDQVVSIYTTYFESTKTNSNDFIGALGLGSKSPFSYTDNFTVTAIKDGKKGIYSAFINQDGVPSIVLMLKEDTDEINGVEVKFSVNNSNDYYNFKDEANFVYRYFSIKPVITGFSNFVLKEIEYAKKDIIPGIHERSGNNRSIAVMGNISYPIDIPNAEKTLTSNQYHLLSCNLEIHFDIGELDFQASREALSYIPLTIDSIKKKLDLLQAALYEVFERDANAIDNLWERVSFVQNMSRKHLWKHSAHNYVEKVKLPVFAFDDYQKRYVPIAASIPISNVDLEKWNIHLHCVSSKNLIYKNVYLPTDTYGNILIQVKNENIFVIDEMKTSPSRVRNILETKTDPYNLYIFIRPINKKQPMMVDEFFNHIYNPSEKSILKLQSSMIEKASPAVKRSVQVVRFSFNNNKYCWTKVGELSSFDPNKIYYYVLLKNTKILSSHNVELCDSLIYRFLTDSKLYDNIQLYGVRKGNHEDVKAMKNWINFEDDLLQRLDSLTDSQLKKYITTDVDNFYSSSYNFTSISKNIKNPNSLFVKFLTLKNEYKNNHCYSAYSNFWKILQIYNKKDIQDRYMKFDNDYKKASKDIVNKYPLLSLIRGGGKEADIIDYIDMIDTHKGV